MLLGLRFADGHPSAPARASASTGSTLRCDGSCRTWRWWCGAVWAASVRMPQRPKWSTHARTLAWDRPEVEVVAELRQRLAHCLVQKFEFGGAERITPAKVHVLEAGPGRRGSRARPASEVDSRSPPARRARMGVADEVLVANLGVALRRESLRLLPRPGEHRTPLDCRRPTSDHFRAAPTGRSASLTTFAQAGARGREVLRQKSTFSSD